MANRNVHTLVGGGVILGLYIAYKKLIQKEELSLKGVIGSFTAGAVFGLMPDILEPAEHPNHRQFFHSIGFGALILWARAGAQRSPTVNLEFKRYFDWAISAYASHLICDGGTPKGLPLIGV